MEAPGGVEPRLEALGVAQAVAKLGQPRASGVLAKRDRKARLDKSVEKRRPARQLITELRREREHAGDEVKEFWARVEQREHLHTGG